MCTELSAVVLSISVCAPALRGGETNPAVRPAPAPLRLSVDLIDGSRIVGQPGTNPVRFVSSLGEIQVPYACIAKLTIGGDHATVALDLQNGDHLTGALMPETLPLTATWGTVRIRTEHVRGILVLVDKDPAAELRKGLVLAYSFDHDDGATVVDQSACHNDGLIRDATWTPHGKVGGAYGPIEDHWSINAGPRVAASLTGDYTVSMWILMPERARRHQALFHLSPRNSSFSPLYAYFNKDTQRMNWHTHGVTPDKTPVVFDVPASLPARRWVHMVWKHAGDKWEVYANGERLISHVGAAETVTGNSDFVIGMDDAEAKGNGFVDPLYELRASLDEVMVWNRALSEAEIQQLGGGPKTDGEAP